MLVLHSVLSIHASFIWRTWENLERWAVNEEDGEKRCRMCKSAACIEEYHRLKRYRTQAAETGGHPFIRARNDHKWVPVFNDEHLLNLIFVFHRLPMTREMCT